MTATPSLAVGSRAPLFTLKDERGRDVSLSDFKDKKNVVLVFYPGDLTPGCTMQLSSIRDNFSKFAAGDAAVFGVNHADAESHAAFVKKCALPFSLLSDTGRKVSAKYGATKKFFKTTIIKRTIAVVGKDGKIAYYKHGMPKDAEILKAIKK